MQYATIARQSNGAIRVHGPFDNQDDAHSYMVNHYGTDSQWWHVEMNAKEAVVLTDESADGKRIDCFGNVIL